MRYALSYVSTASRGLDNSEILNILKKTETKNNSLNITGILLYSEGNFFQILEGEKETISSLFKKISEDSRHFNIIKLFAKPVKQEAYDEYRSDFISEDRTYSKSTFKYYESHIKFLDPPSQKAVSNILKAFIK
ncbi:MAG TPA: BLUF domain-containing protein [Christiangramia sp.]|nr:BLUF domain-containing protein [Christiangramia sp.]